jgi:hypothetical protein
MEAQGGFATVQESGRRRRLAPVALLAFLTVAVLAFAPNAAPAAKLTPCGDKIQKRPTAKRSAARPPLVIADSIVSWKAMPAFRNAGFKVNAQYCRTFGGGIDELIRLKKQRPLPKLVIMQVGSGGKLKMNQVKRARRLVGSKRRLGLVTPREFKPGFGGAKRRVINRAANRYGNIVLFDWNRISKGHDDWFHWDNLHPVGKGTTAMALFFGMIAFDTGAPFAAQPPPQPQPTA